MDTPTEYEGEQCGRAFGFAEDEEATAYPMTPELKALWSHRRQATPSLAYGLMGMFDDVSDEDPTEFLEDWS
jgi:hypothetical protein